MTRTPLALGPLTALLVLLAAGPAAAQDADPTTSATSGFPIALVVLAVVASVYAIVVRSRNAKRKQGEGSGGGTGGARP